MATAAFSGGDGQIKLGAPNLPAYNTGLPAYNTGSLAGQDRQNIGNLLTGNFDPYEYNMASAEKALGTGGGGFAGAQRLKLLDSEKMARMQLGHQELDPYLQREQQTALQSQAERAQAANIAQEGALALQRLQLSESGQSARLSQEEAARLQEAVLQGNQAMDRLKLTESGENSRQLITGTRLVVALAQGVVFAIAWCSASFNNTGLGNYAQGHTLS